MKKLFLIIPILLLLTACGGNKTQNCINSCIKTLSAICQGDHTATCANICSQENEEIRNCLMAVENCEDIDEKATICFSRPEAKKEITDEEKAKNEPNCESVCQKYAVCAGFGDDITEEDQKDAYESCMIECKGWSAEGIACMDEHEIRVPQDCMQISLCGALEYKDYL